MNIVKHNGKTYAEWDDYLTWQYKRDWLWTAQQLGYKYITEFLIESYNKGLALTEIAQIAGVSGSAISRRLHQLGIKSRKAGGRNNRQNATGLFYYKPLERPRRYFCAGEVKRVGKDFMYRLFRCTRCNEILNKNQWIDHKECLRLIQKHLDIGECNSFK